jgi:hypothetical protein
VPISPAAAGFALLSPAVIAPSVVGVLGIVVAAVAITLRCKRRLRTSQYVREPDTENPPESSTAYTLSLEDGHEFGTDCDDLARIDARPPIIDESDGGLFGGDNDAGDLILAGPSFLRHAGGRPVIMHPLL